MQLMLVMGRGPMSRPRLLLNEPSMGLAPILVGEIFAIISQLNRDRETTILPVEQNAQAALEVANRGHVLETGTIRLTGPTADLRRDPEVMAAYLGIG